ncbi:MAG: hypothetical protein EXR71_19330 [Myxococcales bacterium]|nr:hypothetical protein [Myxococcales bacterium]
MDGHGRRRARGADEWCDSADNDCDGEVDEAAVDALPFYEDADGDGFGNASVTTCACSTAPGTPEACDAPADVDCDGLVGTDDADADGLLACEDCDDGDATVGALTRGMPIGTPTAGATRASP